MKTPAILALAGMFSLSACDSKQEQAREKALESKADSLEAQAKATKQAADAQAKATKDAADAQAKALNNAADQTREQK
jgi:hypothetical protein